MERLGRWLRGVSIDEEDAREACASMYFLGAAVLHIVWNSVAGEMMPIYEHEPGRFEKQMNSLRCHEVFDAAEVTRLFGAAEGEEYERLRLIKESAAKIQELRDGGYFIGPGSMEIN